VTTVASPSNGGTVSGTGWVSYGAAANLTATPAAGYRFLEWYGLGISTPVASVVIYQSQSIKADFAPLGATPPNNYRATLIASGNLAQVWPLNSFGQVVGSSNSHGFVWTPVAANLPTGNITQTGGLGSANDCDTPTAINDKGQIVGTTATSCLDRGQPFLWSPPKPNGTTGTAMAVPGVVTTWNYDLDINGFGEISGTDGTSGFLWTPAAPNATAGTLNTDSRFTYITATNDTGQAIINTAGAPTLFTPSVPHGLTGSFTTIPGLPGAQTTSLWHITNTGTIFGSSCFPVNYELCANRPFFWTPTTPNGTTGATVETAPPAGFTSIGAAAVNSKGQIVGAMTQPGGVTLPYLYSGGKFYDLSLIDPKLRFGSPHAINDSGQIVISVYFDVYLLTPQPAPPPAVTGVTPPSGSAASQVLTFTFTDPRGWQDLNVVNILINSTLDGSNACYLAYSPQLNVLYLMNDPGIALLTGLSNSQCSAAVTQASGSGTTFTLALNLAFTPTFAGNKIVYAAARDISQGNSAWQALGTWNVPGAPSSALAPESAFPAHATGSTQTIAFTFSDTKGWQDLGVVNVLINDALDGRTACYLAYSRAANSLYLVNDSGTALLSGLANGQCSVTLVSAGGVGNTLTLTLSITLSTSFAGNRVIYAAARDISEANNSGWQALGTWSLGLF
jgi:hypothetical protein